MRTSQGMASRRIPATFPLLGIAVVAVAMSSAGLSQASPADPQFLSPYLTLQESLLGGSTSPFVIGDVNEDGAPDLISTDGLYGQLHIRYGDGYGNFGAAAEPLAVSLGSSVFCVTAADLNGDRHLDLVFGSFQQSQVAVLLGHGDGTFAPPIFVPTAEWANSVAIGDMNEDGIPDLVVGRGQGGVGYSVMLGDGTGHFTQSYAQPSDDTEQCVLADMNGDGHLDIVGPESGVHLGDGTGAVTGLSAYAARCRGEAVAVGDLDADGAKDVVVADLQNQWSGRLFLHFGGASANYDSPRDTIYDLASGVHSIVIRDLDRNGRPEVIVGGWDLRIYSVTPGGRLVLRQLFPSPGAPAPLNVTCADINGDGWPDVLAGGTGVIGVYLGGPSGLARPAPSVTFAGPPGAIATGDFLGRGRADAAVLEPSLDSLIVVGVGPDGQAVVDARLAVGHGPNAIAAVDADGDGSPEIVVADSGAAAVTMWRHAPGGDWSRSDYAAVPGMRWIALGDLDGDGRPDLVTENSGSGAIAVLPGTGTGFGPPRATADATASGTGACIGDFNGDGKLDLAVGDASVSLAPTCALFAGSGDLGLTRVPGQFYAGGREMWALDINGDSLTDVFACASTGYSFALTHGPFYFQYGGGANDRLSDTSTQQWRGALADVDVTGFTDLVLTLQGKPFTVLLSDLLQETGGLKSWGYGFGGNGLDRVALADLTGDGLPDLVVTDPVSNLLWIAPHVPAASTGVSPIAGRAGGPTHIAFAGSSPNPTRGAAAVRYSQLAPGQVRLAILDVRGRIVRHFAEQAITAAGALSLAWDGRDDAGARVGPGIYFARLTQLAPGQVSTATGKLVVLP